MKKRGWFDDKDVTERFERYKREAGLDYRDDVRTFFDLFDVEEGRR